MLALAMDVEAVVRDAGPAILPRRKPSPVWIAGAAAAALVAGIALGVLATRRPSPATAPLETAVVLAPAIRAGEAIPVLRVPPGRGTATVLVVLDAPLHDGAASVELRREGEQSPIWAETTSVAAVANAPPWVLVFPPAAVLRPGRHVLTLRLPGDPPVVVERTFRVEIP